MSGSGIAGKERALLLEIGEEPLRFLGFRWTREDQSEGVGETLPVGAWRFAQDARGEGLRCFQEGGIVQKVERLERRVRTFATGATAARVRQVKGDELREGRGALDEGVEAPTVAIRWRDRSRWAIRPRSPSTVCAS